MTDFEACVFSEVQSGVTKREARKLCDNFDRKKKKRFAISSNGIVEADSLEPVKLTVSADQENTVRFVGKGHDIEQMFIKEQVKHGDTREHAETLAQGMLCFMEDKPVVDSKGNASVETVIFYSHNPTGKREFHDIERTPTKEPSAYDRCVSLRKNFKDTQQAAENYSALIMYDKKPTEKTLKLRRALEGNVDEIILFDLMAQWQLEREKIEIAEIETERKKKQVTVGDLQNKSKEERIAMSKKKPFDHSHRLTTGDLFTKKRGERR
jgi:hypothetical protein